MTVFQIKLFLLAAFSTSIEAATSRVPLMDGDGNRIQERRDGRVDFAISLPPSALIEAWGGWSYPFRWLPKDAFSAIDPQANKFGYAYVRPNVRLLSSIKVNQAELRLDVYPLSFVGGTFGTVITDTNLEKVEKFEEWSGYNCDQIACQASNVVHFAEFKFKWALPSEFFGVFFYRRDWGSSGGHNFDLAFDASTALPFKADGDFLSASLRLSYIWRNTPEPENLL